MRHDALEAEVKKEYDVKYEVKYRMSIVWLYTANLLITNG